MNDNRPIGVFDSGLGGLTVAKEIFRLMPNERIIYLGDTARVPYGGKSEETIRRFGLQDAKVLMDKDVKMLIVACNTVSSVAMDYLQTHIKDIPVIGVVLPGARAAVLRSAEKRVGVIGTAATVRSGSYARAINNIDPGIKVYCKPCPLFVPLVEEGLIENEITQMVVRHYLYEMVDLGIDCMILGCTHYPILMEVIQSTVGNRIQLVDSALWTAKEAQNILQAMKMTTGDDVNGLQSSKFLVSDITPNFETVAETLLGVHLPGIEKVSVEELEEKQP
ncbi:MAG: glutamate racemase [Chitinispirillia bacterium]|nr:glutamate racemase [Chitinispirillia bacterium]MCL2269199.1 glutamate racemase [Chitinispirillia bacterium]